MEEETKLIEQNKVKTTTPTNSENEKLNETVDNNPSETEREAIKKKATLLFLQGKRSVFIRDYQAAVVALSESCMLFSGLHPNPDDAFGDPYFYYGKALLEVGRSESGVLGDQVQDKDDDDDDDDDDEYDDEEEVMGEKPEAYSSGDSKLNNENGSNSTEEKSELGNNKEQAEGNAENKDNDSESGEINDLQLSWENLEYAKLIYSKKADSCKETAIKLAETYLCLGDNGLESENYTIAIEDLKQAFELQRKHLKEEDRRIAETLHQLGVAHSLNQNYDEAITFFKKTIEQLEKKISSLENRKKIGDKKTEEEEKDAFYTMDGEIDEIRGVIKDVNEKIKDMMECKNQMKAELVKHVCGGGQASSSSSSIDTASSSSSVPTTDISHLIKKKRKNDDNESNQEKKPKTDN